MQRVKEKAIQLLQDQIVDRVIGWRAGEFFYDLTPSVFTSVEDIEKNFVWSVFSGANLSKYLIAESRKGGKAAVFLKPCDSYSFVQLLKEHRILRETVYAVGVQCGGMCDMEAIKEQGLAGVTAVTEDGEALCVSTIYGEETIKKADALLLKCKTCKSKKIVCYDELLGEQGEENVDCGRFDEVQKLEAMTAEERYAFWRGELSPARAKSACSTTTIPALRTRPLPIRSRRTCSISSGPSTSSPAAPTAANAPASVRSISRCICSTASSSRTSTSFTATIRPEPILTPARRSWISARTTVSRPSSMKEEVRNETASPL